MAVNDIIIYDQGVFGYPGDVEYAVTAQSTLTPYINVGEPVLKALGATVVTAFTASSSTQPVVGTDYMAGVAASSSSETASVNGTVKVTKLGVHSSYLANVDSSTLWNTQALYDANVGKRVLLKASAASAGVVTYTILATDSATYGCVILPLDIVKYPGKARFSFRGGLNYLA